MAMIMRQKRGTRAQIEAAAAANELVAGQIFLITDEGNMAMATAADAYETFVKVSGFRAIVGLTQAEKDALNPPDPYTHYIVRPEPEEPGDPVWAPDVAFGSSLLVWADAANSASLSLSGSNVTSWGNLGALGGAFVSGGGVASYSATARNGLPGVSGASGQDPLVINSLTGLPSGNEDSTLILVGYMPDNASEYTEMLKYGDGTDGMRGVWSNYGNSIMGFAGGDAEDYKPGVNWYLEDQIISFEYRGTGRQMDGTINGTDQASDTRSKDAAAPASVQLRLIHHGIGVLQEAMVLDRGLTAGEREKLHGYLAHKWGLAGQLPGGHPYKAAAPAP